MLKLLETHIKTLKLSYGDTRDPGLFSQFLAQPKGGELSTEMLGLPLLIPEFLRELTLFVRREDVSEDLKTLAAALFSYVFNPFDFIDDEEFGYLGFVDDALVLYYALSHLEAENPSSDFASTTNPDISRAVKEWEAVLNPDLLQQIQSYAANVYAAYSTMDVSVLE